MSNGIGDARKVEIVEIAVIMSTEGGRNFISRILDQCGTFSDTYDKDTHEHAKNAGRRQIGLWLQNELLEAAPLEYQLLLKERMTNEY